jgi:hypothetical protein
LWNCWVLWVLCTSMLKVLDQIHDLWNIFLCLASVFILLAVSFKSQTFEVQLVLLLCFWCHMKKSLPTPRLQRFLPSVFL